MARDARPTRRWAIVLVALAVVSAACTNGGGGDKTAEKPRSASKKVPTTQPGTVDGSADPTVTTADPSPDTTSTANGQPVTGRQLLQASRARFTRPLPTVVPTTAAAVGPGTTSPPTTTPDPSGTTPGGGPRPPDMQDERPSQEIIAAAYHAGTITYSQYLLYRAYALFWDPRLPREFDGVGSTGEDDLFTEARSNFAQLDADTQTKLAPFLERPADAGGYGCPLADANGQPATWTDSGTASVHFKVWACATNGAADDIATVVATLDELYPAMAGASAMGPPVPDTDGGDARTDVYLLDTIATRERNGTQAPIDGTTIAASVADGPYVGSTASSYLLVGRPRLGDRAVLRRTLVHQFFHSLEYAHNFAIKTVEAGRTPWFFEASAAWAEWQFLRPLSALVHGDYFTGGFVSAPELPLEMPSGLTGLGPTELLHPTWAYLWPFFMQQEAGGDPAAVFDTWRALETASDWNAFHQAVDAQLPFAASFRDFTVRNLNLELGPAFEPHYADLDPNFPNTVGPNLTSDVELTEPGTVTIELGGGGGPGLASLASQYDLVAVGAQSNTRTLALDFTDVPEGIDVTVMTEASNGVWTRHDLAPGDRLDFDFTDPAMVVNQFYVILGNHDREPNWAKPGGGLLGGSYTITAAS